MSFFGLLCEFVKLMSFFDVEIAIGHKISEGVDLLGPARQDQGDRAHLDELGRQRGR